MMTTTLASGSDTQNKNLFNTISWTTLLVSVSHIVFALITYFIETGREPDTMFKYIASGLFGTEALSGGTLMIIWGIVFHFMIAFIFTLVLFPVYPLVTKWLKNKYITGIFYGLLIWTIMNCIVIPFSHTVKSRPMAHRRL